MTDSFGRFTQIFQPQESLLDEQGMPVQTGLMGMNPTLLGLATGLLDAGQPTVGAPTPVSAGLSRGLTNAMAFQQAANQQAMQQAQFVRQQQEAQRQQQLMQRRQQALQTLSGGDPRMMAALEIAPGQVVGTMLPQEQEQTALMREAAFIAGPDATPEEVREIAEQRFLRPPNQTNVNIPPAEKAQDVENAKFLSQARRDQEEAATAAQRAQLNVNRAKQLIRTADPSAIAPLRLQVQRFLRPLGVDIDTAQMSAGEALQSVGTGFVMDQIQNTKGAVSDAEMRIFAQAAPGLGRSREGNLLMLELLEAKNKRDIMLAKEQRKYAKERGGRLDFGWFDRRDQLIAQNPLFTEDVRDRIDAISQEQGQFSPVGSVGPDATHAGTPTNFPEGSIIENEAGQRFVVMNGRKIPLQE